MRNPEQQKADLENLQKARAKGPWNKGKSYTIGKIEVYANKGAWRMALIRTYRDRCMICGWDKAPCDCHHIEPKGKNGKHTLENGVILCPNHHRLANLGMLTPEALIEAKARTPLNGFRT